jgi:hypothetical protein
LEGERFHRLERFGWESFGVFGGVLIFSILFFENPSASAETPTECSKRIEALAQSTLVQKKGDQLFIPTELLKQHPLFFRNVLVQIYSQPYLSPFFRGFEKSPRSIHHAERGLEFGRIMAELDRQQTYSFEDVLQVLKDVIGRQDDPSQFELDFSRIEKEGLYLNFIQPPEGQNDLRLRMSFAKAWAKNVLLHRGNIPLKVLAYKGTHGSYLVESAFFISEIRENVRKFVVDELLLPWGPFEAFLKGRYHSKIITLMLTNETGQAQQVSLAFSRRLKVDEQIIYEVSADSSIVFEGVMTLGGGSISWEQTSSGSFVGFVAAPDHGRLQLTWASLMGSVIEDVSF